MFAAAADFPTTTVSVQTCTGQGRNGKTYAASVNRDVWVSDTRKLVRSPSGDETVSETTLFADPDQADLYTANSRVTVNGRTALVILTKPNVIGELDVDHVAVHLT